jgi:bacterioferritin-associated ferredoxin
MSPGPFRARRISLASVYVCICNGITDHQIREAAAAGCSSMAELTMRTGAGANCGSCLEMAMDVLQAAQPAPRESLFPIVTLSHAA